VSRFCNFAKLDKGHKNWIVHPKIGRLAALDVSDLKQFLKYKIDVTHLNF
jgi:hypothetical protein